MKNILFMRHLPTIEQLAEIGADIHVDMSASANKRLATQDEVDWMVEYLRQTVMPGGADIYGVFPPPLRRGIADHLHDVPAPVRLYESWSVDRAPLGAPPKFAHFKWVRTWDNAAARAADRGEHA